MAICRWVIGLLVLVLATGCGGFAAPSSGRREKGQASPGAVEAAVASESESSITRVDPTADRPRAIVEETSFDFGVLDLNEVGEHEFTVRNEGTAPLELRPIASTCKCISLEIEQPVIDPKAIGRVSVYWKSGEVQRQFAQATSIQTNDPALPVIQLKVLGSYLPVVAAEPPELHLPRVEPDETAKAQALIVSQRLEAFTLENLQSSLEGVEWNLEPAPPADLARLDARSGWRLTVQLPCDLPTGPFQHWVAFDVSSPGDEEAPRKPARRLEMPLVGKVLRRVTVHGKNIETNGTIRLGTVISGSHYESQYIVKVRDKWATLGVTSVETTPPSVQVSLAPYGDGSQPGLYSLRIEVPPDAPHGVYRGPNMGEIAIKFDHPRIPELRLALDFVVAPPKYASIELTP